jgi:hypothetical protein
VFWSSLGATRIQAPREQARYFNFTNLNLLNNTQSLLTGLALLKPSNSSLLSSATKNTRLSSSLGSYKRAPRLLLQKYLTNLGLN